MYAPQAAYSAPAHRFNPNAPAFRGFTAYGAPDMAYGAPTADAYAPYPVAMNAAMLGESHPGHYAVSHAAAVGLPGHGAHFGHHAATHDVHQTSFGSSNTSFSGPSTPATAGPQSMSKRSRYTHNPYAASNASTSEPTSPALAPAVAPRLPADSAFFNATATNTNHALSGSTSSVSSPVYAPEVAAGYSDANAHPIAFSINEQFAQARGNLTAAACTARGRHMLVGALRQQHTDKIQTIFDELAPNVAGLIMDPQGGHVVRTLIEFLNEQQIATLVSYLTPEVVLTIATSSQNTRRVLQTLFERHRTPALQPVVDVLSTHAIALATTQQGCIAVMRCLEHAADPQKMQLLMALTAQLAALTMDPYGNYVVQAILQYFPRETACEVIEKAFTGHWVQLSCNKFASNVMEKFIQASTPLTRKTILEELVYNADALGTLMQDGFGNFVLQQIIDTCTTGPEYRKLADKVRPLLAASPFGHKIEAKLKSKRFGPSCEAGAVSGPSSPTHAGGAPRESSGRRGGQPKGRGEHKENAEPGSRTAKGAIRGPRLGGAPHESSASAGTSRSASITSSVPSTSGSGSNAVLAQE